MSSEGRQSQGSSRAPVAAEFEAAAAAGGSARAAQAAIEAAAPGQQPPAGLPSAAAGRLGAPQQQGAQAQAQARHHVASELLVAAAAAASEQAGPLEPAAEEPAAEPGQLLPLVAGEAEPAQPQQGAAGEPEGQQPAPGAGWHHQQLGLEWGSAIKTAGEDASQEAAPQQLVEEPAMPLELLPGAAEAAAGAQLEQQPLQLAALACAPSSAVSVAAAGRGGALELLGGGGGAAQEDEELQMREAAALPLARAAASEGQGGSPPPVPLRSSAAAAVEAAEEAGAQHQAPDSAAAEPGAQGQEARGASELEPLLQGTAAQAEAVEPEALVLALQALRQAVDSLLASEGEEEPAAPAGQEPAMLLGAAVVGGSPALECGLTKLEGGERQEGMVGGEVALEVVGQQAAEAMGSPQPAATPDRRWPLVEVPAHAVGYALGLLLGVLDMLLVAGLVVLVGAATLLVWVADEVRGGRLP
jgi:hypothetical protein